MSNFVKAQTATLSNGMEVSYLHLPTAQDFALKVEVPVGAAHDPVGKEGLSHILEHTVFCGLDNMTEDDFSRSLRLAGGGLGATTGTQFTRFDLSASAQKPDHFMLISDLMRQLITEPNFPSERIEVEKQVILNERADGIDSLTINPLFELNRLIQEKKSHFADVIGSAESILSVTSDDLRSFMRENYDAGHMSVYAAGPMPFEQAMEVMEQTLSAIPNLNMPKKPHYQIESAFVDERVERPDLLQNYTALMFVRPPPAQLNAYLSGGIANGMLFAQFTDKLRQRHGCFYSPDAGGWDISPKNAIQYVSMSSTPEDSVIAANGLKDIAAELGDLMPDDEVQAAIDRSALGYTNPNLFAADRIGEVAVMKQFLGINFDTEEIIQAYKRMTPEDVREQARITLAGLTGMYVQGPEPDKLPALEVLREAMPKVDVDASKVRRGFNGPANQM